MARHCVLVLPFPPTTNNLFAGKAKRYVSKPYRVWKEAAGKALNAQHVEHFSTPVSQTISLGRPDKKRRDLGNYEKALNDLLVTHSVLMDDSLIHKLTLQWDDKVVGAMIEIEELA